MRDVEVASAVIEVVVKFKKLEEFTALLKDYHNGYDVRVVEFSITSRRSTETSTIHS